MVYNIVSRKSKITCVNNNVNNVIKYFIKKVQVVLVSEIQVFFSSYLFAYIGFGSIKTRIIDNYAFTIDN